MGEKGNAVGFGEGSGAVPGERGREMLGGSATKDTVSAAAEGAAGARGEAGESTGEIIGGLAAKTGGEFLAGAVLGAATEKLEDRSKRKKAAGGGRTEH